MIVRIRNLEPCWVEYGYEVEIPDGYYSDAEKLDIALEQIYDGQGVGIVYGPEVMQSVETLDQEFELADAQQDPCGRSEWEDSAL